MTLSPVEIARKVLEAEAERPRHMHNCGGLPDRHHPCPGCDAESRYILVAREHADTLARAVIELSAENEKRAQALVTIREYEERCSMDAARIAETEAYPKYREPDDYRCGECPFCLALAALSPTEGDGRKENNG